MQQSTKNILLLTIVGIVVGIALGGLYYMTHLYANPAAVGIDSVQVSDKAIVLKGGLMSSSDFYNGYRVGYSNETLYITIIVGSLVPIPLVSGDMNISIPNTYGSVKQIYLTGGKLFEPKLIWPKDYPLPQNTSRPAPPMEGLK